MRNCSLCTFEMTLTPFDSLSVISFAAHAAHYHYFFGTKMCDTTTSNCAQTVPTTHKRYFCEIGSWGLKLKRDIPALYQGQGLCCKKHGGRGVTSTLRCPHSRYVQCVFLALHNDITVVNCLMDVHVCHSWVIPHTGCIISISLSIKRVLRKRVDIYFYLTENNLVALFDLCSFLQ